MDRITGNVGEAIAFSVTATDPDGDPLVLSMHPLPLPAGATLETTRSEPGVITKVLRWTPDLTQGGTYEFFFRVMDPSDLSDTETVTITVPQAFIRGDANGDGELDVSDAVRIPLYLFSQGITLPVPDAADVNDSGEINLTDAVFLLNALFKNGPPPAAPYPDPGVDPTRDNL